MWQVYILKCADGAYTRIRTPVTLAYSEEYPNRSSALKREAQIKRWTKQKKLALIEKKIDEVAQKVEKENELGQILGFSNENFRVA